MGFLESSNGPRCIYFYVEFEVLISFWKVETPVYKLVIRDLARCQLSAEQPLNRTLPGSSSVIWVTFILIEKQSRAFQPRLEAPHVRLLL